MTEKSKVPLEYIEIENESYFKIGNYDSMRPFFMSIVSDSNHWMFISSNGGLTAGRKNAEFSLFPYYTDDKITESAEITGSKSIFRVHKDDTVWIWEPFSNLGKTAYRTTRNLYKNSHGNKLIFEEINHDLQLTFSYQWNSSNRFGFVRKSQIHNNCDSKIEISVLDGIQNVLPYGVGSYTQTNSSNLVDAYKRNQLLKNSGLGIYALSAIIVDKAEPSEALKANVVWSLGLDNLGYLVSSLQLDHFRRTGTIGTETDVKAEKGAYFIHADLILPPNSKKEWQLVANVNQDHSAIIALDKSIKEDTGLYQKIQEDIDLGTKNLIGLCAASDGLQDTKDVLRDTRHFSNTLFNIMRGGIFDHNYDIEKRDFRAYLVNANKEVAKNNSAPIDALPEIFAANDLKQQALSNTDVHFKRLCLEYLPLKFSRRHGDPSRPWNRFSINTRSEVDGSKILDYEGNWRDIFQNWEALSISYPEFLESMIHKFLNASTFDGYNPYRVTKGGFDWETIEPDDPWSYIGYWGDHQIIYLLKFLERFESHNPKQLESLLDQEVFVYANVPYKIKSYEKLLENPKDTILFDEELDKEIRQKRAELGADGALLQDSNGSIVRANFLEKILATTLAKLSNFIPEGGIWMNTQRPEWNDANNALVGNGVSMVTLYYLRRFLNFFKEIFENIEKPEFTIAIELFEFFDSVAKTLARHNEALTGPMNDQTRKNILDGLGKAGASFRNQVYENSFSGEKRSVSLEELKAFIELEIRYLEHSIKANRRKDDLYHAYNLMSVTPDNGVSISYLEEMLEGQVAVLSSGYLSSKEALNVLDALKHSKLFREDQYSYLLYPNKELPLFLEKNNIPEASVKKSKLLTKLVKEGNKELIVRSVDGSYHFNGNFNNANDVTKALDSLSNKEYKNLIPSERNYILQVFEEVFNHKAFTGRSGTFYGYEGLGSIYWHMVSKLFLAVQECCLKAVHEGENPEIVGRLLEHYYEINEGIGVHKSPTLYGAFPTDPYSHTPAGKGAQQPGMTGQVKEDILSRFGELGAFVNEGKLCFEPCLLRKSEFLEAGKNFTYIGVDGIANEIPLPSNTIAFTYCQVPIIYKMAENESLIIGFTDGTKKSMDTLCLNRKLSESVFKRKGEVSRIEVALNPSRLK
ncbi:MULTISPECIES: hypothetical protein [Maribacter]|uniref:Cellobiose phosphorylase n=1 Tax=Maribacter flavus TaxID=1658664 RepID=A0ABU7IGK4_9FLAO|nr:MULTISPECIES: hypothetical protein [Maribacter]MDC6404663.1 hypothetical protein [Maribacter sp. PR66]MEE1972077.1 hypothetical protein [Maribacter flavus]